MVIALIALFVAFDGPATAARFIDGGSIAKNSITASQIRNRTLGTQDLSRKAVSTLQATAAGSVGASELRAKAIDGSKLADGAVGTGVLAPKSVDGTKLGDGAVGPVQLGSMAVTASKLADEAVGGAAIANGSLQSIDLADVAGSVVVDFQPFGLNECQKAEVAPTPVGVNTDAKITDDVILVTPAAGFSDLLTVSGNPGANNLLRIIVCRTGVDTSTRPPSETTPPWAGPAVDPPETRFNYIGIDTP